MDSYLKKYNKYIKLIIILVLSLILESSIVGDNKNIIKEFQLDETVGLSAVAMKDKEEKPKPVVKKQNNSSSSGTYSGDLTGYSADCPLCSGKLGCLSSYNVYKNGVVTYPDKTYGNVRIVASSKSLACGSIVKINPSRYSSEPVYAIVLDRGVGGKDLDILVANEQEAYNKVGRIKISYSVLRRGW